MLLLLFSFFTFHVVNCQNETKQKEKFNESSLLRQYRNNFLEVQAFIKDVEHKFHANGTVRRGGDKTQRLSKPRDVYVPLSVDTMMETLRLNSQQTKLTTLLRSRPVFPGSIPPFTTEFNRQHLQWDKLFPSSTDHTITNYSRLRLRPIIPGLEPDYTEPTDPPESGSDYDLVLPTPSPKPTFFLWDVRPASSTPKRSTVLFLKSINTEAMHFWLQEITTYSPIEKWMKTLKSPRNEYTTKTLPHAARTPSTPTIPVREKTPRNCSRTRPGYIYPGLSTQPGKPLNTSDFENSSPPYHIIISKSKIPFRIALERNADIKTTVVSERPDIINNPVTAKFIEATSGNPLNTSLEKKNADDRTTVVGEIPNNAYVPITTWFIVDQAGFPLKTTRQKTEDVRSTVVMKRPDYANIPVNAWFIEDKNRIAFRTALEKNADLKRTALEENADVKTMVVGERPDDVNVLVTGTTGGDGLQSGFYEKEQDSDTSNKTRRLHPKVRRRQQYHHSYKQNRERNKHRNPDSLADIYRNKDEEIEYPIKRQMKYAIEDRRKFSIDSTRRLFKRKRQETGVLLSNLETRSTDSSQQEEAVDSSNEMSQFHHNDAEEEIRIKHIGRRDNSRHRRTEKEKLFKELKDRLKIAETRKKINQMMQKADLLKKIVEGSSYSDEEESLKKNLIQALKYPNRT